MVFQSTGKTTSKNSAVVRADFSDLERVKNAENKSLKDLDAAERNAEKIIDDMKRSLIQYRESAIADLNTKLDEEYKIEEQKAIEEAKRIKEHGDAEATQLKSQVLTRIPEAVEFIVKAVKTD